MEETQWEKDNHRLISRTVSVFFPVMMDGRVLTFVFRCVVVIRKFN